MRMADSDIRHAPGGAVPAGMVGDTLGIALVRSVVRRVLARMFGRPPFGPETDPGDPGLMGPDAASWRVIAEPAAIAGGIRGLFMQGAHPLAMAGVNDHSAYQQDPLGRLRRTSLYVSTTAYGSMPQALGAILKVRQVHRRVTGVLADGRAYDANDPHLLTWISIALTDSFLDADRRWAPVPLPAAEADRFVAEQSYVAALLDPRVDVSALLADRGSWPRLRDRAIDLPMYTDGTLPTTVASLRATVDAFLPELAVDDAGRATVAFLVDPPLPLLVRGGYGRLQAGARASLRPAVRAALDIELSDDACAAMIARTGRILEILRTVSGTAPSRRLAYARATADHRGIPT